MADDSLKAWLTLSLISGLGGSNTRKLLKEFGSPEAVLAASINSLKSIVKADIAAEISNGVSDELLAPTYAWLQD
ncbi:MAG: DNA-protecting protein DprA, partial [Gallionella sp.]